MVKRAQTSFGKSASEVMTKIYFLHGITGSKNNFIYLAKHFPNSESFDLIGWGSERKPNVTYDKKLYLNFIEDRIKQKCIIVGHSLGAILAKEFALQNPNLVEKLFLISYPLQENPKKLRKIWENERSLSIYLKNGFISRLICHSKIVYKYLFLPFAYLFNRKYYLSIRDYFHHTYQSLSSSISDTILKDNWHTLLKIKDKVVLIVGEKDWYVDKKLAQRFAYFEIRNMGHIFFNHEDEIAEIIKNNTP